MPEHVIGISQTRTERQDDATGAMIGESAHAFGDGARQYRCCREVCLAGVQDDGLAFIELVIE
jgi:hypothetical protein